MTSIESSEGFTPVAPTPVKGPEASAGGAPGGPVGAVAAGTPWATLAEPRPLQTSKKTSGPNPDQAPVRVSTGFKGFTATSFARAMPLLELVRLASTAETRYFYVAKKNPKKTTGKLEFRKYDPRARKHVLFKEAKIK